MSVYRDSLNGGIYDECSLPPETDTWKISSMAEHPAVNRRVVGSSHTSSANKAPVGYARDCAVRIATDAAISARNQPARDGVLRAQGILI